MKIYYINLDRCVDKDISMRSQFPEAIRISAVDGKSVTKQDILPYKADRKWRDPNWNRRLTKGEVGCILSHIKAWKICVDIQEPILILEDDAEIKKENWKELINPYINSFDLLYLGRKKITGNIEEINEELETPGFSYWCCSYIVSPRFCKKLLEYFEVNPLIPTDEVVPLIAGLHRHFKYDSPFISAAFKEDLIAPFPGAYSQSETETPEHIWEDYNFTLLTVATDELLAYRLFDSTELEIKNLGKGVSWDGGNMSLGPGGGQKLNLIRKEIQNYDDNDIVMFLDGYDTFIHASKEDILSRYFSFRHEIVFSSEKTCWPDSSIENEFPETDKYKYLNSGAFIGTVKEIKKFLQSSIENTEDDQLYCQKQYLSTKYNVCLDYESYIFFSLSGLEDYLQYKEPYIVNSDSNCTSCILHGNGGEYTKEIFSNFYDNINKYNVYIPKNSELEVLSKDILVLHNFLSTSYCEDLINCCEEYNLWEPLESDKFPAREIRLKMLEDYKFFETFEKAYYQKLVPAVEDYWFPLMMYGIRDLFAIKYSMDSQRSLANHHDMSLVSGSIKLNDNYIGGVLNFPRQNVSNIDLPVGSIILWPGQVSHGHESTELLQGTKYSLTLWTSRMAEDIYDPR